MTFTRLLELYKDCGVTKAADNKIFRLTPYGITLFNTALNTNYFNANTGLFEVTRKYNQLNGGADMLVVTFAIGNTTITLRDCGEDAANSYKSHVIELLMAWLTQVAGFVRSIPLSQAITGTRTTAIVNLAQFDPYAFRQLLKQDFDNPKDYYVCNLKYTSLFFPPRLNSALLMALVATENSLLMSYDGNPDTAWNIFAKQCTSRNIAKEFRLTADDRQAITNWLSNCLTPTYMHAEDDYDYKTSMLNGCLENKAYRLWGKFCASVAKRVIYPKCNNAFKTQC